MLCLRFATHGVAKILQGIIRSYLDETHIIKSRDEMVLHISELKLEDGEVLASLDVESLFTNVPVNDTIEIILDTLYNSKVGAAPPSISKGTMKTLLEICTVETPFESQEKIYLQTNGVSMGSPLGPLFADFYMSHIENSLLSRNLASNPRFYKRYVDDRFVVFRNKSHLGVFKRRFHHESVLRLTHEIMSGNKFHFLDIAMELQPSGKFSTKVYIKPTDKGVYFDFSSAIPREYKKSVVKSLVERAYKCSSSWEAMHLELNRIRSAMANNNFPQKLVDSTIKNKLSNLMDKTKRENVDVNIYTELHNLQTYQKDKHLLKSIAGTHCKVLEANSIVNVVPYFKSRKLSSFFSTRRKLDDAEKTNLVYQFNCSHEGCNASYIGYTRKSLKARVTQHNTDKASSIFKHKFEIHENEEIHCNDFQILHQDNSKQALMIAEALLIKSEKPSINIQMGNTSSHILKIY